MNFKKLSLLTVALALALTASGLAGTASGPVYQPPQSYYLALGDSMAYGFQPTKAKPGARPSDFDTGYVDVFAARLRKLSPKIQVVNYGCPGESTVTFTARWLPRRSPTASSCTTRFADPSSRRHSLSCELTPER